MKKKILATLLSLAMVATLLVGCGAKEEAPAAPAEKAETSAEEAPAEEDKLILGYIGMANDAFMSRMAKAVGDRAEELGMEVIMGTTSNAGTPEDQVRIAEDMIAAGADFILSSPMQADAMVDVFTEAAEKGIIVVCLNEDVPFEGKTAHVGVDDEAAAYMGSIECCKKLEKGSNVIVLTGDPAYSGAQKRLAGWQKGAEDSGMNILATDYTDWSAEQGLSKMEDMISKYGDEIDAVFFANDPIADGGLTAIVEANLDKTIITGSSGAGFLNMVKYLEGGYLHCILGYSPEAYGYTGVDVAYAAYKGEEVAPFVQLDPVLIMDDNYEDLVESGEWAWLE